MSSPPLPGRSDTAIIEPMRSAGCPQIGPLALMVSTRVDLKMIREKAPLSEAKRSPLMSRLYLADGAEDRVSVTGPMMGAPYAVALMETLIAWGARTILFFGWCGALSPDLAIGDIVIASGALIDEGTSLHYGGESGRISEASRDASDRVKRILAGQGIPHREGLVWSTDAPFRETPEKVTEARNRGAVAVEMETSALFTVGRYRNVSVGAVLAVSDDLSSLAWKPGFRDERFRTARRALCDGFAGLCRS